MDVYVCAYVRWRRKKEKKEKQKKKVGGKSELIYKFLILDRVNSRHIVITETRARGLCVCSSMDRKIIIFCSHYKCHFFEYRFEKVHSFDSDIYQYIKHFVLYNFSHWYLYKCGIFKICNYNFVAIRRFDFICSSSCMRAYTDRSLAVSFRFLLSFSLYFFS